MDRDLESEIRQAARLLEMERESFEMLSLQNTHQDPIKRQIQAEEYALAKRRLFLAARKLNDLINS